MCLGFQSCQITMALAVIGRGDQNFSTGESQIQTTCEAHHNAELVKAMATKEIPTTLTSQRLLCHHSREALEISS